MTKKLKLAKPSTPVLENIIYIISDANNHSKIGITSNLENRLKTYQVKNPTACVFSHYVSNDAPNLEKIIKLAFNTKMVVGSKDCFDVKPQVVDTLLNNLIYSETDSDNLVAMSVVPPTNDFFHLLEKEIRDGETVEKFKKENYDRVIKIFAREFNLGIPEFDLPKSVIKIEPLISDIYNSQDYFSNSHTDMLANDHVVEFYHLVKLNTGKSIAVCTSYVSMPYPFQGDGDEEKRGENWETNIYPEILKQAHNRGWYVFRHDHWSWWNRGNTALLLFMQKTPVSKRLAMWQNSFKKWVFERKQVLVQSQFSDLGLLNMAIEDICYGDALFPLDVLNPEDFAKYLKKRANLNYYDKNEFPFKDAYDFLFKQWTT